MVLQGAAGELISTSGKWPSNIQRDMLRRCKAAKVAYMQKHIHAHPLGCVVCKSLPVALPHEVLPWLVRQGILPVDDTDQIQKFWDHARSTGMPTMGAADFHIPLYVWGDDARFTETHEDKLVAVAFGRLMENSKNALQTVWPLFVYQQGQSAGPGTLNTFMEEVVNSFNILFSEGVMVETPSGQRKRVYAAVVQYQGDWKWHKAGLWDLHKLAARISV
ncbi:unnamed protein product [Symbiodinium necroappetens]|uniref:Uncharacterized protein n=1 Tax=Symbiodinium necroappetens TaxID=1628268 RepID=A0A813BFP3_9DINO|nr:unnamed protein product [Symbiodinium necroappetens]